MPQLWRNILFPKTRGRRWVIVILRIVVIAYIGLALVLSFFQTQLIFPGAASQGRADSIVRPSEGAELVTLQTKSGDKVTALFGGALNPDGSPRPDASTRPTILYFYGNGMCMADCTGDFMKFRRAGFNMMVPDFVGYGMSGGKPSESGVYATADACFDHLLTRSDIDATKIIPFGWSLGAAAAIHLAATRAVPCLVTVSAFTSMTEMAHRLFPYLPTSLILQHRFENDKRIGDVKCPIFIGHGTRDRIVPFDMSAKLAAAANAKVTKYDVIDGDHNDVFDVGGAELRQAIGLFIESARQP